jgi:hypothetical protein
MPSFDDLLGQIQDEPAPSSEADNVAAGSEAKDLEERAREEHLKQLAQDREERKKYADYSFKLVCVWLGSMLVLVALQGFGAFLGWSFELSDSVLITLVSSTTGSIVAIFVFVAKYLFPQK